MIVAGLEITASESPPRVIIDSQTESPKPFTCTFLMKMNSIIIKMNEKSIDY